MNVGIIVPCRYDSVRLPGKILKEVKGKKILQYIYERLCKVSTTKKIIIATSLENTDDIIVDFCIKNNIDYFRGSKNNVAQRLLDCADKYHFDYFVRINGDNIFPDYNIIDEMIEITLKNSYNFVNNVKERTFPVGMSVEIIKTEFFRKIIKKFRKLDDYEHVTSYLYEQGPKINSYLYLNTLCPDAKNIKLSLDDENDLRFVEWLIGGMDNHHTTYLLKDIYELSKKYN